MRIAHVVNTMQVGGAEVLVAQLCRMLRRLEHDVSIHCIAGSGVLGKQLHGEGIPVHQEFATSRIGRMLRLADAFRRLRPDVVHCHNVAPTVVGAPAARLARVASVVSTRHSLVEPPHIVRDELQYSIAARCCDHIVGICQATCTNLRTIPLIPKHKITCIYNGVARMCPKPILAETSRVTFVHVARLAAVKDQEALIRAFAIAHRRLPGAVLWIVGDGMLREHLQRLAVELGVDSAVTFFGEQAQVAPYLMAADIFLMSSLSEGLPMALLEAMSVGLPAIVTDVGGMAEVVRLAGNGSIVPPRNPESMASQMCSLAGNPIALKEFGLRARNCYEQHFSLEHMAQNYLNLYGPASTAVNAS
jgi:glycosyltransferase involved in cell wall biosynthesis